MASLFGVDSTSSYNGMNNLQGFGGLASGLDRDSLIQNMLYGTTSKIEKQKQEKTIIEWKQTAMRNIIDKMVDFANKYTATMASSSNLFSAAFWDKNSVSVLGKNSDLVSIAGRVSAAKDLSILGVKQLAEKASWSSKQMDTAAFQASGLDVTSMHDVTSELAGKTLTVKYDNKDYTVTFEAPGEGETWDTATAIANALQKVEVGEGDDKKTLDQVLNMTYDGSQITFSAKQEDADKELKLTGGTALTLLGFEKAPEDNLSAGQSVTADTKVGFKDWAAGRQITFNYNGKNVAVKIPGKDELKGTDEDLKTIADSIQKQLNDALGSGRVQVSTDGGKLGFETTVPGGGSDTTSVFKVVSGDSHLVGKDGVLGLQAGQSTHVDMSEKILGENDADKTFTLNGVEITVTKDDTRTSLMNKINSSGAKVSVSYQESTGQFTFTSKEDGASGKIQFGTSNADGTVVESEFDGAVKSWFNLEGEYKKGQDAVVTVKSGNGSAFDISRGANTFDFNGVSVTVKGEFGYVTETDEQGNITSQKLDSTQAVRFDVETDTDTIVKGIKEMVDQYNEILELVNKELTTRPDRGYKPLTSQQKKELSEDEAKTYEEKAKEGMLFGDSDLRSLSSDLRFILNPADLYEFEKLGISVSSSYSDNGKIVIDEQKLKQALTDNPDKVREAFTREAQKDENGNVTGRQGIAYNLSNVMDKYVKTIGATKGILIEKAGSSKAPTSITKNVFLNQMKSIDEKIANLERRMKVEQDRYIKQFTSLEAVISQMNAQSGWLSQFGGGF